MPNSAVGAMVARLQQPGEKKPSQIPVEISIRNHPNARNTLIIEWNGERRTLYQIERSYDLTDWEPENRLIEAVDGNCSESIRLDRAAATKEYFRVRLIC